MGVSVIVPCFNEEKYISECLLSLINNGFDNNDLEILVVDGGSNDKTLNIVNGYILKYNFIKIINNHKKITPVALNIGIKQSKYNRILIAGAHTTYPYGYISKLNEQLNNKDIFVVGGQINTIAKNNNEKTKAICYVLSNSFGVGNSGFRVGVSKITEVDTVPFGLYKKEVFDSVGYYNEKLIRNQDIELSKRIKAKGYKIWLEPSLKCNYYARETYRQLALNNFKNGYWNMRTIAITRSLGSLSLRHYIPLLFILSILLPVIAVVILGYKVILFSILSLVLYFTFLIYIISKSNNINKINIFRAFLTIHFSYGIGSLIGMFNFK